MDTLKICDVYVFIQIWCVSVTAQKNILNISNFQFVLTIDKWNNGDWDLKFYDARGPVCQVINQYVSRAWAKLRQQIVPEIPEPCYAATVSLF